MGLLMQAFRRVWAEVMGNTAPPEHRCHFEKYHMRGRPGARVYQCRGCGSFYGLASRDGPWKLIDRRPQTIDRRMADE